jgi:hypothetical protein
MLHSFNLNVKQNESILGSVSVVTYHDTNHQFFIEIF